MNDFDREQVLHKVVAGSAFLFALCVLPVAQYLIKTPPNSTASSNSPVVHQATPTPSSTPTSQQVVLRDIPTPTTPEQCRADQTKQLSDLDRFEAGKKAALEREYQTRIIPYQQAIAALEGSTEQVKSETEALNQLINDEYQPYLARIAQVEAAIKTQRDQITSLSCAIH